MSPLLTFSVIVTVLALILYTVAFWGVWGSKQIRKNHLTLYWLGLIADIAGSTGMTILAGGFTLNLHAITGLLAVILMVINVIWATRVYRSQSSDLFISYRKASLVIWIIWIISFITGMMLSMGR